MKRFYLAVPAEREEETIKKLGELGAVQLTRWVQTRTAEKSETEETCKSFLRLYERMDSFLTKTMTEKHVESPSEEATEVEMSQIKSFTEQTESQLDKTIGAAEKTNEEIKNLKTVEERLDLLANQELRLDEIGSFRHIFVKVGSLNNAQLHKLGAYTGGTSVVYATKPGRPGEAFLVVTGLKEDLQLTESTLKLLNFEEFTFPQNLNPDPKAALGEVKNNIDLKEKEVQGLKEELLELKKKFDFYKPSVLNTLQIEEVKSSITRTEKKSLIHGWIPSGKVEALKSQIQVAVPNESVYLKFENPNPEDKVPVQLGSRGPLRSFEIFTKLQGVPNYFEINPTPIYMVLYVTMFGMMFGDIGGGALFVVIGILLARSKKGFLVFSKSGTRKLGQIIIGCGLSSIVFGFLYGEFFLVEIIQPLLLNPLQDITEIIIIALVFGVSQIVLALTLNIINMIRRKEPLKAILGGKGIIALIFYLAGIDLAIQFINFMGFDAFLKPTVAPFTIIALATLALIFLSPLLESILEKKKAKSSEKLIEGFGEGLETFIAFMANSFSYVRLAAFAIAHGALALAATIFAGTIGNVPSLIFMNVIVFLVEGFAAYIQSLRLMYYEFSTKFYAGDGTPYKPFKTIPLKPKV